MTQISYMKMERGIEWDYMARDYSYEVCDYWQDGDMIYPGVSVYRRNTR